MPPTANISPVGVNPNLRPSPPEPTPTPEPSSRPRTREQSNSFSRPPDMRLYTTVTDAEIRQLPTEARRIIVQNHRDYTRSFNELKRILLREIEELKQLLRQAGMNVPGDLIRLGSKKSKKKKPTKRNKSKKKKKSKKRTKRR